MTKETTVTTRYHTPKNLGDFAGQFCVWNLDKEDCTVLFSSYIAEQAYDAAEKIHTETGLRPVVYRVSTTKYRTGLARVLPKA